MASLVFFGALFASASAVPDISGHSDAERTCKWYGIGEGEYCCPHAKHCLKPVRGKTCGAGQSCADGETCCPLTKLCVTVHAPCDPSPHCPATAYCCPDAHRCMTPTSPGTLCKDRSECASDEICCPTSHECVKVGGECTPPLEDKSWPPHGGGGSANAEEARWLVHEADWGYLSSLDLQKQTPTAQVASYSDGAVGASTGRIFLYLMTEDPGESEEPPESKPFAAALTLSQAILDPADYEKSQCGSQAGTDPEDPRCAKLTLSGMVVPSKGTDIATGKAALFARHPQMKTWPADHGFGVFELRVTDVWMIAN